MSAAMAHAAVAPRLGRLIVGVLCLAQFVFVLDAAVVAVALPAIQDDLGMSPARLQAVGAAYALSFGALLILAGRLADLFGARRAFTVGLAAFTAASAVAAASGSAEVLIVARALQGAGAAIASPAALALLMASADGETARTRAFAAWGAVAAGGAVAGQLIGGALTDVLDWRWIFLVNLPIAAAVLTAAGRLPALPPAAAGRRVDGAGAALLTGGLVLVVAAATRATSEGVDPAVLATALAGLLVLGVFIGWERRVEDPLLRLDLLVRRGVWQGNAISFLAAAASTTVVFLAAIYLQRVLSLSVFEVGLSFAPVTAAIVATSALTARVSARIGVGATLAAGQSLVAVGAALLGLVSAGGSHVGDVLPGLALVGIGSGLSYGPAMAAATTGIAPGDHGVATAVVSTMQQLGAALGLAALTLVAFGGHGGEAAVLGNADAFARGFLATAALALAAVLLALGLAAGQRSAPEGEAR